MKLLPQLHPQPNDVLIDVNLEEAVIFTVVALDIEAEDGVDAMMS